VFADHYPYATTGSDGNTRLVPPWVRAGERADLSDRAALEAVLADPALRAPLEADVRHEVDRRGGPENIVVMEYPDEGYLEKTLAELMSEMGLDAFELAVHLQRRGFPDRRGGARLRGFSLSEIDVEIYAAQPWMATASDAGIALPGDGFVHARFYGTFPRRIRRYAIERGILPVAAAIRSATSLPAQILGVRNRGLVREGFHADLVVLDLASLRDTATFFDPHQHAEGVVHVLVGAAFVVEDGELTGALPGVVITPTEGRQPPRVPN
jgi:N-acyl-D-amino-acid deacylase